MSDSNTYFKELLKSLYETDNLSFKKKNDYWIKKYFVYQTDIRSQSIQQLPQIISLIHPEFLINSNGTDIGDLINHNRGSYNESITNSDACQISKIDDQMVCEFNNYVQLRKKCHADHYWPYSLGGPTILENRILLCRFHNVAKSNSIMNKFWEEYPQWLNNYLNHIFNLKQD